VTFKEKEINMSWKRSLIGLATATLLAPASYAVAQQETSQQPAANRQADEQAADTAKTDEGAKKEKLKLKIFELKHIEPSQLSQFLSYQTARTGYATATATVAAHDSNASVIGVRTIAVAPMNINVAANDEKNLLFVRGTSDQVARVEKLVKALDVPADKLEKQSFGDVHILPLKHSENGEIQSLLSQLGINTQAVQLGKASVIVIQDSDDDEIEQIEEVVTKLDRAGESDSGAKTAESTSAGERERR
jgi:type II secretory pathway component GspD/PulD (secretin)